MKDPIVEEVRRVRRQIEADCGNDWDTLTQYLTDKQKDPSVKTVSYPPKKLPDRGVA